MGPVLQSVIESVVFLDPINPKVIGRIGPLQACGYVISAGFEMGSMTSRDATAAQFIGDRAKNGVHGQGVG